MGKKLLGLDPMSTTSELSHLAMPINFLAQGKNRMAQASFEPGTSRSRILRSAFVPHWLGIYTRSGVRPWVNISQKLLRYCRSCPVLPPTGEITDSPPWG